MNNPSVASSSRTTPSQSQSLRPRTRRLISGLDDEQELSLASSNGSNRVASPRGTPYGSRPVSPIPTKHPSRATSLEAQNPDGGLRADESNAPSRRNGRPRVAWGDDTFSWGKSWTALQGLASNVLGSELDTSTRRKRKAFESAHRRTTTSAPPAQWGPSGAPKMEVGAGSKEERDALVRARKRKDLLNADGYSVPDVNGRFKRRTSEDHNNERGIGGGDEEGEGDGEALVYLHRVKREDTMQGLAIRYNVPQSVLRKANRMWAHDSVQTRKVIVLPVDACGVKGKPVSGPLASTTEEEDLLQLGEPSPLPEGSSNGGNAMANELPNGWHLKDPKDTQLPSAGPPSSTASSHRDDADPPWKHDSWVLLPNDSQPTEIARMPRRTLGFFPPRRKSLCYSDGTNNTPSVSFDLPRPPLSPTNNRASFISDHSDPASATHASLERIRNRPARSSSLASSASVGTLAPPALFLQGPGGVGSLNDFAPGPAPDSLNRILGPHLPNVQPPPGVTFNPPPAFPSILDTDFGETFKTGAYSSYAGGAGGNNFAANLSGVEKWVRRTAGQVSRTYSTLSEASAKNTSKSRSGSGINLGVAGMGVGSGVGDLIELTDAFEIGGDGDEREGDDTPVLLDGGADRRWRDVGASARAETPVGMSRRVGRSGERAKAD
ncbi:hypothetical protein NA57DRAFT_60750 [Rhizodiscina lignyota]|uniref:LysM domain-containing protein n=1 Tax=Rhizodiscina lignyota TaxID=1504668 RepID=A0A9P4M0Z3_9PEZI|nr:hypothetical protein NA57DRAFT_60750 [Rhizodiscina lignyota]